MERGLRLQRVGLQGHLLKLFGQTVSISHVKLYKSDQRSFVRGFGAIAEPLSTKEP